MLKLDGICGQQHGSRGGGGAPAGQPGAPEQGIASDADSQAHQVLHGYHGRQAVEGFEQPQHDGVAGRAN